MYVTEIMTRDVQVIRPDATLREAARRMRECDLPALPVTDGRRLLGMITDRDIVVRAIAEGCDPTRTRVGEAYTERVVFCYEDDDLRDVARTLQLHQIRRMPVLDRVHRLIGTVSLGDIALALGEPFVNEVLEGIAQPWHWQDLNNGQFGGRGVDSLRFRRNIPLGWETSPFNQFQNRGLGIGNRRSFGGRGFFNDERYGVPFVDGRFDGLNDVPTSFRGSRFSNQYAYR